MTRVPAPVLPTRPLPLDLTIKRNCSITPRAVLFFLAVTCAISFSIGAIFAWNGLWLVLPFAGIEMAALAFAFYVNAQHATDYERIAIHGNTVDVEVRDGSRVERQSFNLAWVKLVVSEGRRHLRVAIAAHGQEVEVGRHLETAGRKLLARELSVWFSAGGTGTQQSAGGPSKSPLQA